MVSLLPAFLAGLAVVLYALQLITSPQPRQVLTLSFVASVAVAFAVLLLCLPK